MDCDYAMLIKVYGSPTNFDTRYSPGEVIGIDTKALCGNPDLKHIRPSFVERQNLITRMSMRRFTRLTNAHSKKLVNHEAAIALHYMHYNYCRIHSSLRVTPAMEAGLSKPVWSIEELAGLLG